MIGLWDGVAKKAKALFSKCERERIGCMSFPKKVDSGWQANSRKPEGSAQQQCLFCYRYPEDILLLCLSYLEKS